MNKKEYEEILDILKKEVIVATGCTEPIAVAYSAAVASNELNIENIKSVEIWVDSGIYKNGLKVGIPGIRERGLEIAAALGIVIKEPEKKLRILEKIGSDELKQARELVDQKVIKVNVKGNCNRLYIETIVNTDTYTIRVLTLDKHQNIVKIEKGRKIEETQLEETVEIIEPIQNYNLDRFLEFIEIADVDDIEFLYDGVEKNVAIATEGLGIKKGFGKELSQMAKEGLIEDNYISRAQILCAAASEARMAGSKLPVMSCTGSGNHGITVFLTNVAVAEKNNAPREKLLKALALTSLITIYIKSFTGRLSAMCGCGVAAGTGASAGVVYLLNGNKEEMYGAMLNMIGSIAGLICDGGKEGCAYKLALASGWAVQSALLALRGVAVKENNGILSADFKQLFKNLGYVCSPGMLQTNQTILDVMCNANM